MAAGIRWPWLVVREWVRRTGGVMYAFAQIYEGTNVLFQALESDWAGQDGCQ